MVNMCDLKQYIELNRTHTDPVHWITVNVTLYSNKKRALVLGSSTRVYYYYC